MGRGRDRRIAEGAAAGAAAPLNAAIKTTEGAEAGLGVAQQLLGTDEQIAGFSSSYDQNLLKFSQQYTFDPAGVQAASGGMDTGPYQTRANQANALLAQAREAYLAGDTAEADRLYGAAQANIKGVIAGGEHLSGALTSAYQLVPGANYASDLGHQAVTGPMAQNVGSIVRDSRELLDPESGARADLKAELEGDALSALVTGKQETMAAIGTAQTEANAAVAAAENREMRRAAIAGEDAKRQVRDLGLSRGAARSAAGEMATYGRFADAQARLEADVSDQAAGARAKIASEAGTQRGNTASFFASKTSELIAESRQYLNDYVAEFTTKAPLLAQAFLQNQAGIRDQYLNRIVGLQQSISETAQFVATMYMQAAAQQSQERLGSMQSNMALMSSLIGLGGDVLSGAFTFAGAKAGAPG